MAFLAYARLVRVLGLVALVLGWRWCCWCLALVLSLGLIFELPPIKGGVGVWVLALVLSLGMIFELPIQRGVWART